MATVQEVLTENQVADSQEKLEQRKVGVEIVRSANLASRFFRSWWAASYSVRKDDDALWAPPGTGKAMNERSQEHADDAARLLERLREVGAAGITTGELIREGRYGLRPANRIGDLRRQGHEIPTIRDEHGVFRFVLVRENPNPAAKGKKEKSDGDFLADRRVTGLPLWDATVRR